jgi:RHS repeat-associated protein
MPGVFPLIDKESNYYPFGLEYGIYNGTNSQTDNYIYGFQGQEKQKETGRSSFKWRNSIPELGIFFNVDPLSEKYAYQSHYNFSENRVTDNVELEGLEGEDFRFRLAMK